MAYDEMAQTTDGISQLSSMDQGSAPGPDMGGGQMPGAEAGPQGQGPGGPGADTPQEQQAIQMLMQGAMLMRRATEVEPSIRYIVDDLLQKAYLGITKHYGMEQEGKLALQQARLQSDRNKAVAITGPPKRPTTGV